MVIKMKLTNYPTDFGLFPMEFVRRRKELDPNINPKAEYMEAAYYVNNLSKFFYLDIFSRLTTNQNIVVSIYGLPGSGKSYAGGFILEFIQAVTGKKFYICHNRTKTVETIKRLARKGKEFVKKIAILMDEQEKKKVGVGSMRETWDLADIMDMVREFQMCFICISPDVRDHPHDFLIHSLREFSEEKGVAKSMVYYPGDDEPSGFIITKKPTKEFLEAYHKAKSDNIVRVLKGEGTGRMAALKELASKIVKTPHFQQSMTKKQRSLLIEEAYEGHSNKELEIISEYAEQYLRGQRQEEFGVTDGAANGKDPVTLSDYDKKVVELHDRINRGELSYRQAAQEVGKAPSTLHEKIKNLKKMGVIA